MEDKLNLPEILEIYKNYCVRHGLSPEKHLVHLLLIICNLSEASLLVGRSKDEITDNVANVIQSICKFYSMTDKFANNCKDQSKPLKLKDDDIPRLYLGLLADTVIHILLYVAGNDWSEPFLDMLKTKVYNDELTDIHDTCRFLCNRVGWKLIDLTKPSMEKNYE